ncbi:hypothetical protein DOTSEDRAFT_138875 [Dothistroma septosporum NZE10]|uniref:ribonuclease H n=1 Tax=Dothistroma septosporum (strain NZE10 / CBS 128990) TaxID=675120 RepID=M2YKJ9_DOTSN|nr:hypothetical protein DOTSEDRAFT_138875 [Dothistroma septosporum NZE10]
MVYKMVFHVDGGCRGNGQTGSIGAAAATLDTRYGNQHSHKTQQLSSYYHTPTNQRAEIQAVILALEWAQEKYRGLDTTPELDITIYSDSKYAIGCMTDWIYKWTRNGWTNAAGNPVANRDLIEEASDLDDWVKDRGSIQYIWIPRDQNTNADRYCNEALDEQENTQWSRTYYTDSSDDY